MQLPPRSPFSFLRYLSRRRHPSFLPSPLPEPSTVTHHQSLRIFHHLKSFSHSVEQLACASHSSGFSKIWDLSNSNEQLEEVLEFECGDEVSIRDLKEDEELSEQTRRARLEWLCQELPTLRSVSMVRLLNSQKHWMTQVDSAFVVAHCTAIRGNEAAFQVYKWMVQQPWYHFDFGLASKVADYLGNERKFVKCRDIFDDIINHGRVPNESTFHILVVSYLGASVEGCLDEACDIYNQMIQLGGYSPRFTLHNSLFRALLAKPGGASSKTYLKQAEIIHRNMVTNGLVVPEDFYNGLIWLHSYQDVVEKERITQLRREMRELGIAEGTDVMMSILRACSKLGDVEEAERIWLKLTDFVDSGRIPSLAFVYRMQTFAKVGEPMKSLETFRQMQELLGSATVSAYQKIIEILCDAQNVELAELVMQELAQGGLNPLAPSFAALVKMYLNLSMHERVESTFYLCREKYRPNRAIYNIYLNSLLKIGNLSKAEEIFSHMESNEARIGVDSASCNAILSGWLESGDHVKAEKVYDLMCKKKFDIESTSMEKLEYVLSLSREYVKRPVSLKLSFEQREALVGLLLGGLVIESDDTRKNHHMIRFELDESSSIHSVLRQHLYDEYREWLHPSCKPNDDANIPYRFATILDTYFGFYADQFRPRGRPVVPKLINRWLSPRAMAYWYMYGGRRSQSGDILLKLDVNEDEESVARVVNVLRNRSLECKLKRKDRAFWIGLLGNNATWFWKLVEPYILDGLEDLHSAETEDIVSFIDGEESEELQ